MLAVIFFFFFLGKKGNNKFVLNLYIMANRRSNFFYMYICSLGYWQFNINAFRIIFQISKIDFFFFPLLKLDTYIFIFCWWTTCIAAICKSMTNILWRVTSQFVLVRLHGTLLNHSRSITIDHMIWKITLFWSSKTW